MTTTILYDNHTEQWADLAPRMVEFTKFKLHPVVPVITQDLHTTLMNTSSTWAVVITAGNVILKPGIVEDIVNYCKENNSPLAGHVLDQNGYYNLHPQFFCIQVDLYKQWGKGLEPTSGNIVSVEVKRSIENMHDNYTPLWIEPAGKSESKTNAPDGFASRFIAWLMIRGWKVVNIPQYIRTNKLYSYVDHSHEDIRKFIKDSNYTCQESGVSRFLDYVKNSNLEALDLGFYPVNTEPVTQNKHNVKLNVFAGVCSGVKPAIITSQEYFEPNPRVILFDISIMAIEWQKWLRLYWDGRRNTFEKVFEDFRTAHPSALPQYFDYMGLLGNLDWVLNNICNEQEFVKSWEHWLTLEVEYYRLDLLSDTDQATLVNRIKELDAAAYIWTSNLFSMDWQVLMHEPGYARQSLEQFSIMLEDLTVIHENENRLKYYKN